MYVMGDVVSQFHSFFSDRINEIFRIFCLHFQFPFFVEPQRREVCEGFFVFPDRGKTDQEKATPWRCGGYCGLMTLFLFGKDYKRLTNYTIPR